MGCPKDKVQKNNYVAHFSHYSYGENIFKAALTSRFILNQLLLSIQIHYQQHRMNPPLG